MKGKLIVVLMLLCAQLGITGGILTNTNQSAQFVRTLSRNAATDIDAVYFNPAGTTALADGIHFALYNQTIFQEKTVDNSYVPLAQHEFVGKVNVPFFPDLYGVYKMDQLAVSVGFGPNAGGGSAEFSSGLPSFEMAIANLPPMISAMGVPTTGYRADLNFTGSSVYYGVQANAAYELNEMLSVAVGARYIYAVNTYEGSISNIQINPTYPALGLNGSYMSAVQFFQTLSSVNPAVTPYIAQVSGKSVDVKQTGTGITPLVGLNVKPIENLNIGVKYEMNTKLELTNETTEDGTGQFPDNYTFRNDIPAILGLGANYAVMPQFRAAVSFTYYFDKNANWEYTTIENGKEVVKNKADLVDKNYNEIALGLEYDLTDALLISGGLLHSQTGVSEMYQTDLSHSLTSNTVGLGLRYSLSSGLDLDLGALYTIYDENQKSYMYNNLNVIETYNRSNVAVALGIGYHL